jgi:hypothetical protein
MSGVSIGAVFNHVAMRDWRGSFVSVHAIDRYKSVADTIVQSLCFRAPVVIGSLDVHSIGSVIS